jgi:hypothetical protein
VINDTAVLTEVRASWAGLELLRLSLKTSAFASTGRMGIFPHKLANAAHNLPFIHAFAVLNDVLEQLAEEQHWRYQGRILGKLLKDAKRKLPWRNLGRIGAGVVARHKVAHKGQLLDRYKCWEYIDAVKAELSAWGVV